MWIYLLFAFVVLPVLVPTMVYLLEPKGRRKVIMPFVILGVVAAAILLETAVRGHPTAMLGTYHVAYTIGLQHGVVIIGLYIAATCGSMLASGVRSVEWFGAVNLVAVVVLARLSANGFTSLWCFYAALASGAIALHMRLTKTRVDPVLVEQSG